MPAIPLLDLHISIDGKEQYRIPLDESARIQAKYVAHLACKANLCERREFDGNESNPGLLDLLTAIFYFPTSSYEELWNRRRHPSPRSLSFWDRQEESDVTREYLLSSFEKPSISEEPTSDAIESYKELTSYTMESYDDWWAVANKIAHLSKGYVISEHVSGAEHPLISLPYLFRELPCRYKYLRNYKLPTGNEIHEILIRLHKLLKDAENRDDKDARAFISAYFGYGLRWTAFARCTVPTDRPFIIKMSQKRAVYFTKARDEAAVPLRDGFRKTAYTMIAFADAETNHVSVRVGDTAVRLHRPEARDILGRRIEGPKVDEEVRTSELYLRQDSMRERDDRIWIKLPLRLTRLHSFMLWFTMLITAFAIALLCFRGIAELNSVTAKGPSGSIPNQQGLSAKDATVILVPVAFAATLLLSRDSSTLSARLRRMRQSILMVELFTLLGLAFTLFVAHFIRLD